MHLSHLSIFMFIKKVFYDVLIGEQSGKYSAFHILVGMGSGIGSGPTFTPATEYLQYVSQGEMTESMTYEKKRTFIANAIAQCMTMTTMISS